MLTFKVCFTIHDYKDSHTNYRDLNLETEY